MGRILQGDKEIVSNSNPATVAAKAIELTKATYETLQAQGKIETDQEYIITDVDAPENIDDTIAGYSNTFSGAHISNLLDSALENTYTKAETDRAIRSQLSAALKWKGNVATVADLPTTDLQNGDTYQVIATGLLYAWNTDNDDWDTLGNVVDVSNYFTKTEIEEMLEDYNLKFQYDSMPTASADFTYPIQYTGTTTNDYVNGHFYKIKNTSGTYSWEELKLQEDTEIQYVETLPTTGYIKNLTYGIMEAPAEGSPKRTVTWGNPFGSSIPTKQQAIDFFSKYFTVTETTVSSLEALSLSAYSDMTLTKSSWSTPWEFGEGNFVHLYYFPELNYLRGSKENEAVYSETTCFSDVYPISATSAYFPEMHYYNGNEEEQALYPVASGGTGSVDAKYKKIFTGTQAEWDALTTDEKKEYDCVSIDDATTETSLADAVENGNMNAVTSNAVYDYIAVKNIIPTRTGAASNSAVWVNKSGKVVNVNFAALVAPADGASSGLSLYTGFPIPALTIIRFALFDAQNIEIVGGLVQIDQNGVLKADGQGLKAGTAYWGSVTYITNES